MYSNWNISAENASCQVLVILGEVVEEERDLVSLIEVPELVIQGKVRRE